MRSVATLVLAAAMAVAVASPVFAQDSRPDESVVRPPPARAAVMYIGGPEHVVLVFSGPDPEQVGSTPSDFIASGDWIGVSNNENGWLPTMALRAIAMAQDGERFITISSTADEASRIAALTVASGLKNNGFSVMYANG
jgi:hypothetical protein